MEAIDYKLLATEVATQLSRLPPIEKTVWDTKECAEYLRVGERQFVDRVSKHHKFPTPINYPIDNKRRSHPKWIAGEIMAWAQQQR